MSSLIGAVTAFPMLNQGFYIDLNWLGHFVRIIVEGVGVVGLGVIVFTLILKAITTPFDIYQRVKMRKQSLIMRNMQEDLDKLQKQYANDKQMYNMKMMELQKKNGYSMFGACLPMIISFVILIFAVTAFQSYAQYANLSMYENMAESYNSAVLAYCVSEDDPQDVVIKTEETDINGVKLVRVVSGLENKYLGYTYPAENPNAPKSYFIDVDKLYTNQTDGALKSKIDSFRPEGGSDADACVKYFEDLGATVAAESFRNQNNPGFLWIKNVWYPDVSYQHPIQDYSAFTSSFSSDIMTASGDKVKIGDIFKPADYEALTSHLAEEKEQANGYFILIILTIGLMVLSQFVMMKSQSEANKYQTVDGQGAMTQKVMMIMMPLIYAVTGFLWTAAFSIYIAVSSIIGILITLICNLVLGHIFKKKEEEALKQRYTRTVPWKETKNKKR